MNKSQQIKFEHEPMDQQLKRCEKFIKISEHCLSSALDCARIQCPCIGNDSFVVVLLFRFK